MNAWVAFALGVIVGTVIGLVVIAVTTANGMNDD